MLEVAPTMLTVAELDRRLRAADPGALLVPPRLLRRVIKKDRNLAGIGLQVPHRKCYVVAREALTRIVDRDELGLEPDRELPATVVLLPRPDPERLQRRRAEDVLTRYWRLLFHAAVHRAIGARELTAKEVRARARAIGLAAFAEIRTVLRQERFLLPPQDDRAEYEEFASLYLELANFAPPLVPHCFPAIDDFGKVDRLLAADVDGAGLLAATRPAGAPDLPAFEPLRIDEPAPEPSTNGRRDIDLADSQTFASLAGLAAARGNDVRAALRFMQCARIAPRARRAEARAAAEQELQKLVKRLRPALDLSSDEAAAWRRVLPALLEPASHGVWPAEARLLYNLQKICIDHERPAAAPHPAEWFYSRFKQPFVQPLPDVPAVLEVKRLRRASGQLHAARLAEDQRKALGDLLNDALHRAEVRLRNRLRPRIVDALSAVGLTPANYPERVSRAKLIEELLDVVAARGFLSQPDLRDALSRNQLKLPDLNGPREFFGGDPLLRANRELAVRMPGVYRRGEIYLRWLQRLSALAFGTRPGRWLARNFFLPFGGAFLAIEGPLQLGHELVHLYHFVQRLLGLRPPLAAVIALAVARTVGATVGAGTAAVGVAGAGAVALAVSQSPELARGHAAFPLAPWPAIILGGIYFWLVLHVPAVRRVSAQVLGVLGRAVQFVLFDVPGAILRWPLLRAALDSRATRLVVRFAFKPLLPAAITWFVLVDWGLPTHDAAPAGFAVYVATMLFLSTRVSRELEELTADWAVRRWEYLRDFLPGLFRMIVEAFKRVLEAIDRALYAVDEWLRFRSGDSMIARLLKTAAGLVWNAVAYVLRFIIVLFVEPQINPIKHFPVVTISHKLLLPMIPSLAKFLIDWYGFETEAGWLVATLVITKIPGIFGFLVWEFKENWRLYRANRPAELRPSIVGHHGETVPRLLRPGFHSGTLPKLYAKLRRAERRALKSGDWRPVGRHVEALHHVEEAVRRFGERELLAYVNDSPAWTAGQLRLAHVEIGSNQVRFELECTDERDGAKGQCSERFEVTFQEMGGCLIAGISDPGWKTTAEQSAVLKLALTGFDKVAGADLRRDDIESLVAPASYEVTNDGLTVWPDDEAVVVYDLNAEPEITPRVVSGKPPPMPEVPADRLLFRLRPVLWDGWVAAWDNVNAVGLKKD
jgi:hypothetical protein